jgi:hypothetical protein
MQLKHIKGVRKMKECERCGDPLNHSQDRYCSKSCAASVNNMGVQRNINTNGKILVDGRWVTTLCRFCNKPTMNQIFCSSNCRHLETRKNRKEKIVSEGGIKSKKDKWILEELRGKCCESCKEKKWLNEEIPLDIHHIDGDSDNNIFENLQLLCPNCHRLTDNHGSKNKNGKSSKRKLYRNKRYADGLST